MQNIDYDLRSVQEVRDLARLGQIATEKIANYTEDQIDRIIRNMVRVAEENAVSLAQMAVEETGFGKVADKTYKNHMASTLLYDAIKDMKTIGIVSEDPIARTMDVADPVGLLMGIVPSTNPTSTAIFKSIIAIKARNAIVFSPHPSAAKCTLKAATLMRDAAVEAEMCIRDRCVEACIPEALKVAGEQVPISELLEYVEQDRAFYDQSGGGVTLGGGEVTSQPEAAINLLQACKQEGLHTAIETCGYTKKETILRFAEYVDLFLFDLKHIDPDRHFELTGVRNEMILENLEELIMKRNHVKVRMPMLKGINDSEAEIRGVIEFLKPFREFKNFEGIDLLPYHKLGVNKYVQLGMDYPIEGDPSLDDADLDRIEGWIREYDFPVSVIRH